jgi:hypothetical protein
MMSSFCFLCLLSSKNITPSSFVPSHPMQTKLAEGEKVSAEDAGLQQWTVTLVDIGTKKNAVVK